MAEPHDADDSPELVYLKLLKDAGVRRDKKHATAVVVSTIVGVTAVLLTLIALVFAMKALSDSKKIAEKLRAIHAHTKHL